MLYAVGMQYVPKPIFLSYDEQFGVNVQKQSLQKKGTRTLNRWLTRRERTYNAMVAFFDNRIKPL